MGVGAGPLGFPAAAVPAAMPPIAPIAVPPAYHTPFLAQVAHPVATAFSPYAAAVPAAGVLPAAAVPALPVGCK